MRRGFFYFICLCLGALLLSRVSAQELIIEGNGAGSQNSIVINSGSSASNSQTNSFRSINEISATTETGNNSASRNNGSVQVRTGDATVKVVIDNRGNLSVSDPQNPTLTPVPQTPTQTPAPAEVPTTTPSRTNPTTSEPSSSPGSGSGGGIGGAAAVLGLSNTSSESELSDSVAVLLGLVCLTLALAHLRGGFFVSA